MTNSDFQTVNQIDTDRFAAILKRRGMTRTQLSLATGYGKKSIYNLETGKERVSERLIDRVCEELKIDRKAIEPRENRRRAS